MGKFQIIILGCMGGPYEDNLSSYLLIDTEKKEGIVFDGGTLLYGLKKAEELGALKEFGKEAIETLFLKYIKAYLISHVHLDHVLGLVVGSQVDIKKSIMGTQTTIDLIRDHLFNGKIWTNYGNEGERNINIYQYLRLKEEVEYSIPETSMHVTAFPLNHSRSLMSTAFLVRSGEEYILYFGDTSSDFIQEKKLNSVIWEKIAPLVREKKLKALFLECSYPNRPEQQPLYGHLTPQFFMQELHSLSNFAKTSLHGIKIIVTHRKGALSSSDDLKKIEDELLKSNDLKLDLVFPYQGMKIKL